MNPLFNQFGGKSAQIRNMIGAIKNPQGYVQQMMNNPQLQQVLSQYGNDPQKAFYGIAQQMGVNPQEILSQLKM